MKDKSARFFLEDFLLKVSSDAIVRIINLSVHAFHPQESFSENPNVRALDKLACFTNARDTIAGIQFVKGELMENENYFQINAWFSSTLLKGCKTYPSSLLHSEWSIFLPVLGHETQDEKAIRLILDKIENPSSLINRVLQPVRLHSTNPSEIRRGLKIVCTNFDENYHDKEQVLELKEVFKLLV